MIFFIFLDVYLFLRERNRQSASGGGAEREGDTETEAVSRLWAVNKHKDRHGARAHELWDDDLKPMLDA